jgi:hypothetical protein
MPLGPQLMLYKPGHAKDQIVSIIHGEDNERLDRVQI